MKLFVFITLLFLILIMGCTTIEEGATQILVSGKGLAIANFTTNFNTLRVNEATNIRSLFQNVGGFEAKDIRSVLYGEGLLERVSESNYTESILPDKQAIHVWTLKVPLKLSQTESTTYVISSRVYYLYNYSGFQQVGFVSPDYSGDDLPLSSNTRTSPITASINVRNPVRTLPQDNTSPGTIFTATIVLKNEGKGNVDYFNCSILSSPPCRKEAYLSELRLSVPQDWTEMMNMSAWIKQVSAEGDDTIYILNYNALEAEYDAGIGGVSCSGVFNSTWCNLRAEALNHLRMIRGEEARIVLQFAKEVVDEVVIDSITVSGDFGYEVDVSDFTQRITLLVLGD